MEKKIILFMPVLEIGGVEKNFIIIANNLHKKFKKLTIVSLTFSIKNKLNKKIKFTGPKSAIFEKFSRRVQFLISLFYLSKQIISNRKSIVVCFQGNMYCVYLCKLLGTQVILRSNSSPSGWSKNRIKIFLYRFGFKLADGIIVNSTQFKKQLKKKFNVNAKCIYNPLNLKEIKRLSTKKIKFNFFKKDFLNIINIGRLENQKDQFTLIKAINEINHIIKIKLLIIGNGSNQLKLQYLINKNKLKDNVKILNNVSNPFPYLVKSNLFVLSSLYEGLPNVILEALTLNKFVISTNCPTGPSEILDDGKGGMLIPIKNYKRLSERILFFKKNSKSLQKKVSYAKKRLVRFDYNSNINEYYKFIKNFI